MWLGYGRLGDGRKMLEVLLYWGIMGGWEMMGMCWDVGEGWNAKVNVIGRIEIGEEVGG